MSSWHEGDHWHDFTADRTRFPEKPTALVLDPRLEVAEHLAAFLLQTGVSVIPIDTFSFKARAGVFLAQGLYDPTYNRTWERTRDLFGQAHDM